MRSLLPSALLLACVAKAQPFLIGSRSITFFDASRNRSIPTNVYYPGVTAGSNAAVANGSFPVLVVGHGFVMGTDAYANLWNHFVPLGYIVALPATEGSFSPSHANFGQDIAFVASALQAANSDAASPFHQRVAPTSALMGHSMGGGASFLGAAGNTSITTVVNFAAAETNPSAVAACAQVQVPTLMFAGGNDCVTPIAQHQQPMYNALTVPCRAFVSILGGGHCYFADFNFNCNFGELTCSPSPSISRTAQQDAVNDFATLWLDHFLKGDADALAAFTDSVALSTRVNAVSTCLLGTAQREAPAAAPLFWPGMADDRLFLGSAAPARIEFYSAHGQRVMAVRTDGCGPVDVRALPPGAYLVKVEQDGRRSAGRLVVAR